MEELIKLAVFLHQATQCKEGDPEREWADNACHMLNEVLCESEGGDGVPINEAAVMLDVRHLLTDIGRIRGQKCRDFFRSQESTGPEIVQPERS